MAEGLTPTELSVQRILKVMPHRFPFLLVDRILEVTKMDSSGSRVGSSIKVLKNVTFNEPYFSGHFPHRPVMPGVLIIEALAQAGILLCFRDEDPPMDVVIAHINDVKFRKPVVPGDAMILKVKVLKDRGSMIVLGGEAFVDEQKVAEAEVMAHVSKRVLT